MGVIKMKLFCLLCIVFSVSVASREAGRKPRLFLVSTSSKTLTVSTASICYMSETNGAKFELCEGKKKRRSIPRVGEVEDKILEPSKSELESADDTGRVGRFFLYWITTTSISTTTTYTTTYKVLKATCTPPGAKEC